MSYSQKLLSVALAGLLSFSALSAGSVHAQEADLSPEQKGRVHVQPVPEAVALLPKDFKFVTPGVLTVAVALGNLPFGAFASDNKTLIGSDPDIAYLVAESLGLKVDLVNTAWADWPLGVTSGKYDAVISNVTVTEARKEKFDFSSYRQDLIGFFVKKDGPIETIDSPEKVAGLKVSVSSGTNQEQILLRWIEDNKKKGLKPTEVIYFDDEAVKDLALQSGRIDAYFGPTATSAFKAALDGKTRLAGSFSGGWPEIAEIAVTTKKGSGLAPAITAALNAQIRNGNYAKLLSRWSLSAEAVSESRTNPPGLPKK